MSVSEAYGRKLSVKPQQYYIVKDDFIINLRQRGASKLRTEANTEVIQSEVDVSSIMVSKKVEIFSKMKVSTKNDFYDLDRQIENNKETLYRKMNVALRKSNVGCGNRMENPFVVRKGGVRVERQGFTPERHLSRLIFNVQPYWIKKSVARSQFRQK
jgi:hypothetical protein